MTNVRTVSDTKRSFYTHHTRPISSVYRRIVEELMVEMHLLSVNVDFTYDAVYALGVVTAFESFMKGYRPDQDKSSIFHALCRAVDADPNQYSHDAEQLKQDISGLSKDSISTMIQLSDSFSDGLLKSQLHEISKNDSFKYSRLFGIGIYSILEMLDAELVSDKKRLHETLETLSSSLGISGEKITKDLEIYQSNLEKLTQAQEVLSDLLEADRKKREQRDQEKSSISPESANEADELPASPES